jgi:hypothetical protein
MKKIIIFVFILTGCGSGVSDIPPTATSPSKSCTVVKTDTGALILCPDGSQVEVSNGLNGTNGVNGKDAPSVSTVQFCPSVTTNYPTTFPEYGICIDNSIYGVYWDGRNAWLALIPSGYYASTSTTAPCNFTVLTNCQVTQ